MDYLRLITLLYFISSATFNLCYADVYKWKDSEGKLRYSDIPPRSDTKYEVLNKKKAVGKSDQNKTETSQINASFNGNVESKGMKDVVGKANSEKPKAAPAQIIDENVAINAENCQAAQSNLATYKNGGRIKRVNEKGEIEYLTDVDITSSVKSAQKDVEKYCKS